jgi:hypothetical protein
MLYNTIYNCYQVAYFQETSLELPLQSSSESELYKILTEPQPSTSKKRKYETCVGSATTSSISEDVSQLPTKVCYKIVVVCIC